MARTPIPADLLAAAIRTGNPSIIPAHLLAAGIRNNNPGNLMDFGIPWEGLVGKDEAGRCIFKTMQDGVRAMALDILSDYGKKRLRTPTLLVTEYAPPIVKGKVENDTEAYIKFVAGEMGVGRDDDLDLREDDGRVKAIRFRQLLKTKIRMECSNEQAPLVPPAEFEAGVIRALKRVPVIAA